MKNISKIAELFIEFITTYPLNFILLFFLLILEGVVAAATILAIIPFADFLLDPALEDPSRVTIFVVSIFSFIKIKINYWVFGIFFVGFNLLIVVASFCFILFFSVSSANFPSSSP